MKKKEANQLWNTSKREMNPVLEGENLVGGDAKRGEALVEPWAAVLEERAEVQRGRHTLEVAAQALDRRLVRTACKHTTHGGEGERDR